ncbi:Chymotrypsin-like protease CTRL-1 [Armadillidium nasatum]|uniref:Chymotrypsin-like protease CTRL-1 n=1 Tax=Armadillidium nasatum TaxID=96803 RepID=A0A5N5T339_9CRUS|nr:Chymotrypsin-like protease CTRL-1 [Armadillidium nasatum]
MTGACLRDVVCNAESGRFMGYCGYDDGVCCDVTKSCGSSSSAHAVRFQNPAFPNNETEPRICTFDLHIGKGICALRMELETFQLRKYSKDYCPFDSFTVLGTKKGKSSPICGNMTGWITPTNAGLINRDAKKYDPPPTPKPNITLFKLTTPTRSESSTTTTEATTEEATTILTTLMEETITTTEVAEESSEENNKTTKPFVIARSLDGYYGNEEGDYEDKTPNSLFKEIFDQKAGDYCPLFKNSDDSGPNLRVPHPESIDRETNSYSMQNATVTGWGRNSLRSKRTSSVLKKYTAPVDDIDTCVKSWTPYPAISAIKGMHLCLNVTYGTPCHGDSGGPLVSCNNGTRCTLIGVVSFGFPLCRNVGLPAVFTRVTTYKRWIDLNTTPHFYYNI